MLAGAKLPLSLIKLFCFGYATRAYALDFVCAPGPSMLPTMSIPGDVVLVDRVSPRFDKAVPGDIVIVRSPENPRKVITKRLVAKEGDAVTFLVDPGKSEECRTVLVPKGHVWVQGDNIYDSRDSRAFGPVPYGLIYGKVFWRETLKMIQQKIMSYHEQLPWRRDAYLIKLR